MNGTIKTKMDRGYGFIEIPGESKDLFFHSNDLPQEINFDDLKVGQAVTFDVEKGDKGNSAKNIRLATDTNEAPLEEAA